MIRAISSFAAAAVTLMGVSAASAGAPQPPAAPTHLAQYVGGLAKAPGAWSRHESMEVTVRATGTGGWLRPQVEVQPFGHAFTNQPKFEGRPKLVAAGASSDLVAVVSGLKNGRAYAWQARLINSHGLASSWVPFGTTAKPAIRIDTVPPSVPRITSSTNPLWGGWYRTKTESFAWTSKDAGSGVAGFSYVLGHRLHSPRPVLSHSTTAIFRNVPDGRWVLHVWSRDVAGNWSSLGYYKFNLKRHPAAVRFDGVSTTTFNPYEGKEAWEFSLNGPARVSVNVYRSGEAAPVAHRDLGKLGAGRHVFVWHGRHAHHRVVPAGWYWIRIFTRDYVGNVGDFPSAGIHVAPFLPRLPFYPRRGKHIVVSLTKEAVYAYVGTRLVRWSLATTGNPALPTPTGHFTIFARYHPFEFISPWPPGSPYYYEPSWTTYAMEFQGEGYYLHDAPWRSVFGPGSNGPGTPGTNYGGSHGCVNLPFTMAKFLWFWAPLGTPVDILR